MGHSVNHHMRRQRAAALRVCGSLCLRIALSTLGFVTAVPALAADAVPIGVVDLEQAFQRSPLVLALAVRLGTEFEPRRRALKQRVAELARLRNRAQVAPAAERAGLEERVGAEAQAVAAAQAELRRDLEAAQRKHGEEFMSRVAEVAAEVAREKGMALLVRKGGILWTRSADPVPIDITEDVVRAILRKAEQAPPGAPLPTQ